MTYQKKIIKPKHFELIFTLLFVGCASIPNGLSNHKYDNDIDQEDVYEHIRYLSSDALEGRYPGTKGSQLAIDYISHQFKKNKILPFGDNGYLQFFNFSYYKAGFILPVEGIQALPPPIACLTGSANAVVRHALPCSYSPLKPTIHDLP